MATTNYWLERQTRAAQSHRSRVRSNGLGRTSPTISVPSRSPPPIELIVCRLSRSYLRVSALRHYESQFATLVSLPSHRSQCLPIFSVVRYIRLMALHYTEALSSSDLEQGFRVRKETRLEHSFPCRLSWSVPVSHCNLDRFSACPSLSPAAGEITTVVVLSRCSARKSSKGQALQKMTGFVVWHRISEYKTSYSEFLGNQRSCLATSTPNMYSGRGAQHQRQSTQKLKSIFLFH